MTSLLYKFNHAINYESSYKEIYNSYCPINSILLEQAMNEIRKGKQYALVKVDYSLFGFENIYLYKYNECYYIITTNSSNNVKQYYRYNGSISNNINNY